MFLGSISSNRQRTNLFGFFPIHWFNIKKITQVVSCEVTCLKCKTLIFLFRSLYFVSSRFTPGVFDIIASAHPHRILCWEQDWQNEQGDWTWHKTRNCSYIPGIFLVEAVHLELLKRSSLMSSAWENSEHPSQHYSFPGQGGQTFSS